MHAQLHESPGGSSQWVAMSVPGTRYKRLKWMVLELGAPLIIDPIDKPARAAPKQGTPDDQ
eukprot:12151556-Heterocapsa_arctica.AAC.1